MSGVFLLFSRTRIYLGSILLTVKSESGQYTNYLRPDETEMVTFQDTLIIPSSGFY
jgi:hypothetical protein